MLYAFTASLISTTAFAVQTNVLLDDSFDNLDTWKDLSTALDWGDAETPESAFVTTGGMAQFNPDVGSSWIGYGTGRLNMFQALDHQFSKVVDHARSVLTIEFRIRWEQVETNNKDGEGNRFVMVLNHDYPEGGIDLDCPTCPRDPDGLWYGRPNYEIRLRGGDESSQGEPILMYGGGTDPDGEYEFASSIDYWLPGFVASARRTFTENGDPDIEIVPPGDENAGFFPETTYNIMPGGIASESWQRMRYIIRPDRHEIWRNTADSNDPGDWEKAFDMVLPAEPLAPDAPLYRYFNEIEGIRLFWRAASDGGRPEPELYADNVYLDWITVTEKVFDSNYQFWASEYFGDSTVGNASLESGTWGHGANPDGDSYPNGVDRYLNQSPLEEDPLTIETAVLDESDYASWAAEEFPDSYPDPAKRSTWDPTANPDDDPFLNGAEQRLGTDPNAADSSTDPGLRILLGDSMLVVLHEASPYTHGAIGGISFSEDLVTWEEPAGTVTYPAWREDHWFVVSEIPLTDGAPAFVRYEVTEGDDTAATSGLPVAVQTIPVLPEG